MFMFRKNRPAEFLFFLYFRWELKVHRVVNRALPVCNPVRYELARIVRDPQYEAEWEFLVWVPRNWERNRSDSVWNWNEIVARSATRGEENWWPAVVAAAAAIEPFSCTLGGQCVRFGSFLVQIYEWFKPPATSQCPGEGKANKMWLACIFT